jgi:hypothetical protein
MRQYLFPFVCILLSAPAQMRAQHHHTTLNERGNRAMGFDQDQTTHHFLLRPDGGIISVEVKDSADDANRAAIRAHLQQIAIDFAEGRFDAPRDTHGEAPPGVSVMRSLRRSIRYTMDQTPGGARVRIASQDGRAIAAIHEFLRYQIREHHTGDPEGR